MAFDGHRLFVVPIDRTNGKIMKITLVTASFKSAHVLPTALESVLRQTGADFELIVVDGGSEDGTVEVLRQFEPRFAGRLRWVSERVDGLYDALNKGIKMATGDVIGILNADDALASDDILKRVAAAFEADASLDGTFGDIRFVRDGAMPSRLDNLRALKTARFCSGRWFRPWMFRFGTQTAHPATFFRASTFARWGNYSLDYGMYGDFELLLRFIWRHRAKMRYLPLCTTVMRLGGASTNGWRTTLAINRADLRALRDNGYWSCFLFLYARYLFKIWGFRLP